MAGLRHHMCLVAPVIIYLLILAALAPAATAAEKKVRARIRYTSKEEAQWLKRYAETHQPLGASPLRIVPATPEQEHWLNHFSSDNVCSTEDSASGSGYIDFDDDNPYLHALHDWIEQSMEKATHQAETAFQDL